MSFQQWRYMLIPLPILCSSSVTINAMFPNFRYPVRKYLCQQAFCRLKQRVEIHMGVKFELRAGRRSFGQRALDDGQELENVSVAMGHASTRTTELFYARRATDRAIKGMFAHKNGGGAKAFE